MGDDLENHKPLSAHDSISKRIRANDLRNAPTEAERILWSAIRSNKLMGLHFRRQQVIQGFTVDFYCSRLNLVIEVDGDIHKAHAEYDVERQRILESLNLTIIRFTNDRVIHDLRGVLLAIGRVCEELTERW